MSKMNIMTDKKFNAHKNHTSLLDSQINITKSHFSARLSNKYLSIPVDTYNTGSFLKIFANSAHFVGSYMKYQPNKSLLSFEDGKILAQIIETTKK